MWALGPVFITVLFIAIGAVVALEVVGLIEGRD